MSATVAVPRAVVAWARAHHRRTGRPFLFEARPGDCRFHVLAGSPGRYLLTLDPERAAEIGLFVGGEGTPSDRGSQTILVLADAVATALGAEPIRFECDGQQVGRVEIVESPFGSHAVRVHGHVSVTCLSWLLHAGESGYCLWLPGP